MTSTRRKKSQLIPNRTDAGNAEVFAKLFGDRLRFDHGQKRWLWFAEHWWALDLDGGILRLAKQAARSRLKSAAAISDEEGRKKEAEWALRSESLPRLQALLTLAQSEKPIADDGSNWDRDPWLLGVMNGVLDLGTGSLRPGKPNDYITLHSAIVFDPDAKCPRFENFLKEIFDGDIDLISYVHRAVGYSLTGDTSEQCFFCCHGEGANGKSTYLNAVRYVLDDYACNLPFSAFELRARSAIPNDIATLPGRRFVTAIETDESALLNAARIKALTGGDPITARLLYRDLFTFIPMAKFWLAFNHRPTVADDSRGFWRRVQLIPFNCQFDPGAEPNLPHILRAEAPGILAWGVRGCLEWQKHGLVPPASVVKATETYREESDPLRDFVADRCILGSAAEISVAALLSAYAEWCFQIGEQQPLARPEFTLRLEALGCLKKKCGHNRDWTWRGICLKQHIEAQEIPPDADMRTGADVNLH